MRSNWNRRSFLQASGAAAFAGAVAPIVSSCGGSGDSTESLSADGQLALDSSAAVECIRAGRFSAEAHIALRLARARQVRDLNAMITLNDAGALAAARRIDHLRRSGGVLPPLAGLPIVVKDNINFKELPTTGGTPALRTQIPATTAPSLHKLIDAGAIVLGKANMHELAFGITSTNLSPFAGPVKNPYDKTRIPGGSSGGTAVAIAASICTAGLGTDTGGSTRIPAALTGTVGLRPSVGNGGVQRRYHDDNAVVPISHTRDTVGPMGRSVADVALLDSVITGTDVARPAPLAGLRLGVPASFWSGLDNQLAAVMDRARERLAGAGVVLVDVDIVGLADLNGKVSFPVALHEPNTDFPAYLAASGIAGITLADIAAQIASPDVKVAFGAVLADVFGAQYADAIGIHRPAMQALYAAYFAQNQLSGMLFPTTILPAVPIDLVNGSSTVSINGGLPVDEFGTFIRNTDPGSNAGIPGLSLFAGMTAAGLPVGIEIDGPLGSDRTLLAMGLSIERVLGSAPPPRI
jgi:Asp-tRNA(Asn)/Glu-tRNA(Gln) amidotransferase A subunit family amidase